VERHAAAENVALTLCVEQDAVTLRVTDDGRGFAVDGSSNLVEHGHLGLLGMHERARFLGGVLTIDSRPGVGTTVEIRTSL
jgi:NarL family two-component system sensor histidine kinase YdfH